MPRGFEPGAPWASTAQTVGHWTPKAQPLSQSGYSERILALHCKARLRLGLQTGRADPDQNVPLGTSMTQILNETTEKWHGLNKMFVISFRLSPRLRHNSAIPWVLSTGPYKDQLATTVVPVSDQRTSMKTVCRVTRLTDTSISYNFDTRYSQTSKRRTPVDRGHGSNPAPV